MAKTMVQIKQGVPPGDSHFYVTLDAEKGVVLRASRVGLFQLGLAFYHLGVQNWVLDHRPIGVEVADLTVYRQKDC